MTRLLVVIAALLPAAAIAQTIPMQVTDRVAAEAEAAGLPPSQAKALGAAAGTTLIEDAKLTAPSQTQFDFFGYSVALSGNRALVAATNDTCPSGGWCGAVYVFERSEGGWSQTSKLTASDAAAGDTFGFSVSLSGDWALVGAYFDECSAGTDCGAAYAFDLATCGAACTQTQKLTASDAAANDTFGRSVAVSGDWALVGAYFDECSAGTDCGAAYAFDLATCGAACTQTQKLTAFDALAFDNFGFSVALSGARAFIGAPQDECGAAFNCGSVYVFNLTGGTWGYTTTLTASDAAGGDNFGAAISLSGNRALIGASGDDCVAGNACGAAYVFALSGGTWGQTAKLTASDADVTDSFGAAVSLSGERALVGAFQADCAAGSNCGAAYTFDLAICGAACTELQLLTASDAAANDRLGRSVAVSGEQALFGAHGDGCAGGGLNCGAAYVFAPPAIWFGAAEGWHLLAAPGDAETIGSFFDPVWTQCFPGADSNHAVCGTGAMVANVYTYDETASGGAAVGYEAPAGGTDALGAGLGVVAYLFADDDNDGDDDPFPKPLLLIGDEPTLPFTWGDGGDAPLSYTDTADPAEDDGWNLLGNPLRGLFSWDATWDNGATGVDPTAEAYDPVAGSFSSYNADTGVQTGDAFTASGEVAAGVGFFVRTTGASPSLTAPAPAPPRTAAETAPHVAVRFEATAGPAAGRSAELAVALVDGATFAADPGDAPVLLSLATPYVVAGAVTEPGGRPYVSAVIPSALPVGAEVDLAVGASGVGPVTVTWRVDLPDGWRAVLVDRGADAEVEMAEGAAYAADLSAADADPTPGRFLLRIVPPGAVATGEGADAGSVSLVRPNPASGRAEIVVSPSSWGPVRATVYDAVGREVAVLHDGPMAGTIRLALDVSGLAPGVYVLRVAGAGLAASRTLAVVR